MGELHVERWGDGVPALLVHGSISTGEECWEGQRPLADQGYELIVPDRRGYGGSELGVGEDFAADAEDAAELLGGGAHLVGHSYGGVAALLAAVRRPEAVLSLTVIEPPAFALRPDAPAIVALGEAIGALFARSELDDRQFLEAFLEIVGAPLEEMPEELLARWSDQVGPLRRGRPPFEAEIPLAELASAPYPKLVVSGGHSEAFDAVCDALVEGIGAERLVIEGAGHEVQAMSEEFNQALLRHWAGA